MDGGETTDDTQADNAVSNQDSDWVLLEASDDDEPVFVNMGGAGASGSATEGGSISTDADINSGGGFADMDEIENLDASGNLYGFLDDINVKLGTLAGKSHTVGAENKGVGSTAQLRVQGSDENNIVVAGYDNDEVFGNGGNDILFGGNLKYASTNPNIAGITNNGIDDLWGGAGNDHVVFELDGGQYHGDAAAAAAGTESDTLWLESMVAGTATVADLTSDGWLRFDLRAVTSTGQGTGGNETTSQSQTNSTLAGTVTGFENVIATGLGAIDYLAAGTNSPELNFANQQNFLGLGDESGSAWF